MTTARPVLVYDGDCGFCTTSITWLRERFPDCYDDTPYQWADLAALRLTAEQCDARVQWVGDPRDPTTTTLSGARAVGALLRHGGRSRGGGLGVLSRGLGVLAQVPPTAWVADLVYAAVAANRHRLPGGTPACRMG